MADERSDVVTVEVGELSSADVDALGETVLGRVLRCLEADGNGKRYKSSNLIAAFQDSL